MAKLSSLVLLLSGALVTASPRHVPARSDWTRVLQKAGSFAKSRGIVASAPTPGPTGFAVSPIQFGGDPLGQRDSTEAVQKAVATCVNISATETGVMAAGVRDAAGCTVDLEGGEFLVSDTIQIPVRVGNLQMSRGSLRASHAFFNTTKFMIAVSQGSECHVPQGSCTVDINFHDLFLDGSRVAYGLMQINAVMGTTVGPGAYLLNFTSVGIEINGGHEVMILETWLGETNWDYVFSPSDPPKATGIMMNSNDHYIQNSVIFSSLVGLNMRGAANMVSGLHVWFPENQAGSFDATAFLVTGSQNRFAGCYIDCSKTVIASSASMFEWTDGFVLGGAGFELQGTSFERTIITTTEFRGGGGIGFQIPAGQQAVTFNNSQISGNLFDRPGAATRVTKTVVSSAPQSSWDVDFCAELLGSIQSVRFSVTADKGFPTVVARPPSACKVTLESSTPFSGQVTVSVDSSSYTDCGWC